MSVVKKAPFCCIDSDKHVSEVWSVKQRAEQLAAFHVRGYAVHDTADVDFSVVANKYSALARQMAWSLGNELDAHYLRIDEIKV